MHMIQDYYCITHSAKHPKVYLTSSAVGSGRDNPGSPCMYCNQSHCLPLLNPVQSSLLVIQQEFSQQLQSKQSVLTKMSESVSRLTGGQDSPEHAELGRLSHSWLELCHQANKLQSQRGEDLQRSKEYHDCITAMEALFEQVSKEWDNLARWGCS